MKNMKKLRKIMALVLAMVMVLGMSTITAFAAGTNSITVKNAKIGETYKAYKMLDLSVNDDKTAFTYTVNKSWTNFFNNVGKNYVTINDQGYVSEKENADLELFAKAAATYASENNIDAAESVTATDTTVTLGNLDNGYYLITSTLGTLAMTDTTPTNPAATINEKNKDNTEDKKVKEDSTGDLGSENDAQIGDTIEYQVTISLEKGAKDVVYHDKMTTGLTLITGTIKINGLTADTDYSVNTKPDDEDTFDLTFTQTYLNSLTKKQQLILTYSAKLNENAALTQTQGNAGKLTWGNKGSITSTTTTKTYKFAVHKYATGKQSEYLADAVFQLKKGDAIVKLIKINDATYRVATNDEINKKGSVAVDSFTTISTGNITIIGVDNDTDYTLVEIEAPAGYNKLGSSVPITNIVKAADDQDGSNAIDGINSITTIGVENKTGTELPSTGGMGTTLFYVFGAVLVIGAGILLVTRKRMAK